MLDDTNTSKRKSWLIFIIIMIILNYLNLMMINAYPAGIYQLEVKNKNTRTRCEICLKLTIKIQEERRRRFDAFIINF